MIGRIVGGLIGAQAAKHASSVGGKSGMVLGALAFPVVRRLRLPTMLALGAGGYLAKKLIEKNRKPAPPGRGPTGV